MYTDRNVKRFVQPIAVCVLLVLAALPGAMLVCQWNCHVGGAEPEHAHTAHHHSSETPALGPMSMSASDHACEHVGTSLTAVRTAPSPNVVVPVVGYVPRIEFETGPGASLAAPDRSIHSPPGARSSPIPLRI